MAAHRPGESSGKRQAKANAGGVVGVTETLGRRENHLMIVARHAGPVVDDPEFDPVRVGACGEQGLDVGWSEPHGVGDDVGDHPFEQCGIGSHLGKGGWFGR